MSGPDVDPELRDLLCLTMVPGVGPLTSRALLDQFGGAGRILDAPEKSLREVPGVGPKLASAIARARREHDPEVELALCQQRSVQPTAPGREGYPQALDNIHDPPPLLYVRGTVEPVDSLAVAVVGSRKCTPYGLRMAERLAGSLARVGLTIVSGLARGIDAAAHRGALRAGGRTIAVLGNGLNAIYPPEHAALADEVAASGTLFSEFPMRQQPLPGLFPQRNRLISGLSLGVLVIEATPRSGSLSTAHHATEQGREVFAVPGPVDSLASRGCHALIRDGARLVETADDILEELKSRLGALQAPAEVSLPGSDDGPATSAGLRLNDQERAILGHLDDLPKPVDALIALTGLGASQVMATLSILEMRRLIRRAPGNLFHRA